MRKHKMKSSTWMTDTAQYGLVVCILMIHRSKACLLNYKCGAQGTVESVHIVSSTTNWWSAFMTLRTQSSPMPVVGFGDVTHWECCYMKATQLRGGGRRWWHKHPYEPLHPGHSLWRGLPGVTLTLIRGLITPTLALELKTLLKPVSLLTSSNW